MSTSKPKFMYLRSKRSEHPVGCIAYEYCTDNTVKYGVSVFNPKFDEFVRAEGRNIAADYLAKNPVTLNLHEGARAFDALATIMSDVAQNSSLPSRAKKTSRKWIKQHQA